MTEEIVDKLTSELYYDLKDKYVALKENFDLLYRNYVPLYKNYKKTLKKLGEKADSLYTLRFGRKQFNFAVTIMQKQLEVYARENNLNLNHTVELTRLINNIKRPPIIKDYIKPIEENE